MKLAGKKKFLVIAIIVLVIALSSVLIYDHQHSSTLKNIPAPDFQAIDVNGESFWLSDFRGEVLVLHITNIENPLCIECEKELRSQTEELEKLKEEKGNITIITINMRMNPYSEDGRLLAENWWDVNVTWHWVEDFDPYLIAGKYVDYWNLEGAASNPTILLIDGEQWIVGVYHVYQMGKGEIDGVQDAETLSAKIERLQQGDWEGFEGELSQQGISFLGMFVLGIITSLSPCSVALLIAMFSFIMTSSGKEGRKREEDNSSSKEGLIIGVAFTIGMALVFFVIGIFLSSIGVFVRASPFFYMVAGILLVVFGVNNIKSIREMFGSLRSILKIDSKSRNVEEIKGKTGLTERIVGVSIALFRHSTYVGAFVLGILFSLAWAPCAISLVFPVFILMVSQDISVLMGALMLFVFGLGHGAPIIPISTVSRTVRGNIGQGYVTLGKWITKAFGVGVIIIGLVFAARYFGYYLW